MITVRMHRRFSLRGSWKTRGVKIIYVPRLVAVRSTHESYFIRTRRLGTGFDVSEPEHKKDAVNYGMPGPFAKFDVFMVEVILK